MLVVVSPAKNLDYESALPTFINDHEIKLTQPALMSNVKELVKTCKKLSPAELSSMMKISDKLAILNAQRFSSFRFPFTPDNARPAIYAFNGDVYAGLEASTLKQDDITNAQQHLRILSGLYGVLKPLDLMQPYRLEMGRKLDINDSSNLYQYWQHKITKELNHAIKEQGDNILVNLASKEYFSSVKPKLLNATIITPQFKDGKDGKFKVISFYAKKARGLMARFIIENKIKNVQDLKEFDVAGYGFDEQTSTSTEFVFTRAQLQ